MRRNAFFLGLAAIAMGVVGGWFLVIPGNRLTNLFRAKISDTNARVITGPYPLESDFRSLKHNQVTTVVSLLDPHLPYEHVLLNHERALSEKYQMQFLNFPMASILGHRINRDYTRNAQAAADAISAQNGKVYLHCYLGMHRVNSVKQLLQARGQPSSVYLPRKAERQAHAQLLEQAQTEFDAGRYRQVLNILKQSVRHDTPTRLLEGWSLYRLGDSAGARAVFDRVARDEPKDADAHAGLGYCALRDQDFVGAEREFSKVLQESPEDPAALVGMGLLRHRQGRLQEAASFLDAALRIDPTNHEARSVLNEIKKTPVN